MSNRLILLMVFLSGFGVVSHTAEDGQKLIGFYQQRGEERFRSGDIAGSVADFEYVVEQEPQRKPYHWQLGISYYYAGKYTEGRELFELHQLVNSNDVENAVWHFICKARADGLEADRAKLIPIKGDGRVPMMDVHALFAGKLELAAFSKQLPHFEKTQTPRSPSLMFAHLYLGLYYEALGDDKNAKEHILAACKAYKALQKRAPGYTHYMGDTAVTHALVRGWR